MPYRRSRGRFAYLAIGRPMIDPARMDNPNLFPLRRDRTIEINRDEWFRFISFFGTMRRTRSIVIDDLDQRGMSINTLHHTRTQNLAANPRWRKRTRRRRRRLTADCCYTGAIVGCQKRQKYSLPARNSILSTLVVKSEQEGRWVSRKLRVNLGGATVAKILKYL